jgi:hypothetical protein
MHPAHTIEPSPRLEAPRRSVRHAARKAPRRRSAIAVPALAACSVAAACALRATPARASGPEYDLNSTTDDATKPKPLGLMLSFGIVDGGMLSLAYRPAPWLRLHAGAGTNSVSPGFRLGASVLPHAKGLSVSLEGGHFLEGDINGILKSVIGAAYRATSRLDSFGYDFVTLHAGWDIDTGDLVCFLHGGASALWTDPALDLSNLAPSLGLPSDGRYWMVIPTIELGFVGFL